MSAGRADKYHPALAVLHWALAWFILASLAFGYFVLRDMPNTDPRKLDMLEWHMGLGMAIFAAMAARLVVRWRTAKPSPAGLGTAASATLVGLHVLGALWHWLGLRDRVMGRMGLVGRRVD